MNRSELPGVHHFYLGVFVGLIGFLLLWFNWITSIIVCILALWICIDDYVQHLINVRRIEKNKIHEIFPNFAKSSNLEPLKMYESFLHRKFRFFWKFKIVREITGFFDWLFGRKT